MSEQEDPLPSKEYLRERLIRTYSERNELAIALAKLIIAHGGNAGSHTDESRAAIGWGNVVMVDLPDGRQVSWHIAPSEVYLMQDLPKYEGVWDGTFVGQTPGWSMFGSNESKESS